MTPEERKALDQFILALRKRYKALLIDIVHVRTWPRKDDPPFHNVEVEIILSDLPRMLAREESQLADLTYDPLMDAGLCIRFSILSKTDWDAIRKTARRRMTSLLVAA
jgi:hypothetical protein